MENRSAFTKWAVVVLSVLLLAVGAGAFVLGSKVVLYNQSSVTLADVRVSLANNAIWSGTLESGESLSVYGRPDTDGTVRISFRADGKKVDEQFGYVTGGLGERHRLVIMPSLEVTYMRLEPPI